MCFYSFLSLGHRRLDCGDFVTTHVFLLKKLVCSEFSLTERGGLKVSYVALHTVNDITSVVHWSIKV